MNNQEFYNSFFFTQFQFDKLRHTDNVTNHGASHHFIGWLTHGSAKLVSAQNTVHIKAGDLIYIPLGLRYHSYWYPDETGLVHWYSFGCKQLPAEHSYGMQQLQPNGQALSLLQQIVADLKNKAENIGLLYSFYAQVLPTMVADTSSIELAVHRASAYMRQNPHARIEQVASYCGVSQTALYNAFRQQMGITPNTMRQKILCENARELLVTTGLSVEEISSRLGFSSSSYFRKVLHQHTGKTPLAIRKENHL